MMSEKQTFNEAAHELREAYDALMAPFYKQVEKVVIALNRLLLWISNKLP